MAEGEGEGDDDTKAKVNKWRSVPLVDTCTEVITCVASNHGLQLHLTPWAHSTPSTSDVVTLAISFYAKQSVVFALSARAPSCLSTLASVLCWVSVNYHCV